MSSEVPPPAAPKKSNLGKGLLVGCLGIVVICAIAIGIGVFWLYNSGKGFFTDAARDALVENIEQSELPGEQKERMVAQIDRLAEGFKEGEIDLERMAGVVERLAESPLFGMVLVYSAEALYVMPSGLSQQEKEEAHNILQRFAKGVIERRIPEERANEVVGIISVGGDTPADRQLKDNLTDEELRTFIAEAEAAADEAGVTEVEGQIDLAAELERIVDDALNQGGQ